MLSPQRADLRSFADRCREQVHRRAAKEARREGVCRLLVDLERRTNLRNAPALHDANPVTHGHRLDLVMCDVDHGGAQTTMQTCQFAAHADAQRGVEIRQGFVEQEHLGLPDDRAA